MKKFKFSKTFLLLFLIGLIVGFRYTSRLEKGQFLFIGDQFYRFNLYETFINSFFLRKLENFGVHNGWQFTTQYWDVLYYFVVYRLGVNFILAEKILFLLLVNLSLILSFLGFNRITKLLNFKVSNLALVGITLWYCFNPYTLALWHGGVYSLGAMLTYSLAPLLFFYLNVTLLNTLNLKNIVICSLLLYVVSFTFWLFAPLALALTLYFILYILFCFNLGKIKNLATNIPIILILYGLLSSPALFSIFHEFFNNGGDNNANFTPTFGNELGGMWYQFLMLFSWGIYNVWTPRTIYPFYKYYFTTEYIWSTLGLYILSAFGLVLFYGKTIYSAVKKKKVKFSPLAFDQLLPLLVVILFGFSIFMAKAAQPPFGEVFIYLYEHVPIFSVFRTPDIRFGFIIVLCLAITLVITARVINKYILVSGLLIIIFFQSPFLINGLAIYGENNKEGFIDRIIYIPEDDIKIARLINQSSKLGYVLPIPPVEYGLYRLDDNEQHLGQDLLPKLSNKPFAYLSVSNGMSQKTYEKISRAIKDKNYQQIGQFPINFILLRQDISCTDCPNLTKDEMDNNFDKIYESKNFTLYQLKDVPDLIGSSNSSFHMVNPTEFKVQMRGIKDTQKLKMLLSYNPNWKIYLDRFNPKFDKSETAKFLRGDELSYLFQRTKINGSHHLYQGYANGWDISPKFIKSNYGSEFYYQNADGSIDLNLTLLYKPQILFYLTYIISYLTIAVSLTFLIFHLKFRLFLTKIKSIIIDKLWKVLF